MIKSSDQKINRTYRILKVLANQDYLAIDYTHNQYIFSQCEYDDKTTEDLLFADFLITSQSKTKHILQHKESIAIEGIRYNVFQIEKKEILWAKNIQQKTLKQSKFINNFIREAITNILTEILWLNNKYIAKILNVKNFWMLDGHLYLILMPRTSLQCLSLKRSENKRSASQDCTTITTVLEKELNTIKKFASIIWNILELGPESSICFQKPDNAAKQLLIKMIDKKISFEDILTDLQELDQNTIRSRVIRHLNFKSLENTKTPQRRHTLEPSMFNHYQKIKNNSYQTESEDAKLKAKIFSLVKPFSVLLQHKQKQQQIQPKFTQKNSYNFNFATNKRRSLQQTNFVTHQRFKPLILAQRKRIFTKLDNQRDQSKYLNWMKDKKWNLNLIQKINNRNLKAKEKFQQTFQNSASHSTIENEQQLKLRLFSKALKFRAQKKYYKDIQTQTSSSTNGKQTKVKLMENENRAKTEIKSEKVQNYDNVNEKCIKEENIKKNLFKNDEINTKNKRNQVNLIKLHDVLANQLPKQTSGDKSLIISEQCKNNEEFVLRKSIQPSTQMKPQIKQKLKLKEQNQGKMMSIELFDKQSVQNIDQQQIEELVFYELRGQKNIYSHTSSIFNENRKSHHLTSKDKDPQISTPTIQKAKKIKYKASDFESLDPVDIEVISIFESDTKTVKEVKQQKTQSVFQSKSIVKPQLQNGEFGTQQEQTNKMKSILIDVDGKKQQKVKIKYLLLDEIRNAVRQFLGFINILGDITAQCVKSKDKLKSIDWRKSSYFLYQRFYYERVQFLKNLLANNQQIVRKHRVINPQSWELWAQCQQRINLIQQIQKQNVLISDTHTRFAKKMGQKNDLLPKIKFFIKNRDQLVVAKNQPNLRSLISKYTVALIINDFDGAIDTDCKNADVIICVLNSLFGLLVLTELDGKKLNSQILAIEEYGNKNGKLQDKCELVQSIYDLYYPQSEEKIKN